MKTHFFSHRSILATALAVALSASPALSADYTWGFNSGGNWNDSSETTGWNAAGAYPNAIDDAANLTFDITTGRTVTINTTDATVGVLNIEDTSGSSVWTIASSDAVNNKLTFQTSSGNASLTSSGGANVISAPIVLNASLDVTTNSTLTLSGAISGAGAIHKNGTGLLLMTTTSIESGKTLEVTEGVMALIGNPSSFSNLDLRVGDSTGSADSTLNLSYTASNVSLNNTNTITIVSGNTGTAFLQQQNNGNNGSILANVVLGTGVTGKGVTLQNVSTGGTPNSSNFLGVFSDPAGLVGPGGVVTIAASGGQALRFGNVDNTYTGGTIIESGNVQLRNGSGTFFGSGPVTVNGGSFRNNGNGVTTLSGYSSMILNADLNFLGSDSSGNNFTGPINLGATGADTSRIINTTNTGSGSLTISGVISDGSNGFTTGITKTGSANLTLSGSNTYTGLTTISAGTIILGVEGSFDASSGVNLGTQASQGTLSLVSKASFAFGTAQTVSGFGTINIGAGKTVTVSGSLNPGNSPGQINVTGNLALEGTTDTTMELASLGGIEGTDFDNVTITGSLAYDGDLSIVSFGGFNIYQAGTYSLFDFSSQTGNFDTVTFGGDALSFGLGIWSGDNGSYNYSFELATGDLTVAVVPEPGVAGAVLTGMAFLAILRRFPRRRSL